MMLQKLGKWPILFLFFMIGMVSLSNAQQITVSGTITDSEDGTTLIGVSVIKKGTTQGSTTDFDGKYTITVEQGSTLVYSYIGYNEQEMVAAQETIDIILAPKSELLDEVIVIGYGTQKKTDKTGAVSHVTAEELNQGRLTDPIKGIQGKAAGVVVSKKGGDPNAGFSVKIRGQSGLGSGTDPLYVVDGVPGVDPTTIASEDIASFNVLKDASSTAIYGSRGANGVIIITTKKQNNTKSGESVNNIEFSSYLTLDQVANELDLLSAQDMRNYVTNNPEINFVDGNGNTNWQDEIFRSGISQSYHFAFSGADENTSYRASISHTDFDGVIKGSSKKRTIGSVNITQKSFEDRLTLSAGISGTIEHNDYVNYGGGMSTTNVLYQAFQRNPTDPVINPETGDYYETTRDFNYYNPVSIINNIQNERDAKRYRGTLTGDFKIIENLVLGANLAYIRNDDESFYFEPSFLASNQTKGYARRSYNNFESKLLETTLKYSKTINTAHNINFLAGYSWQEDINTSFFAQGEGPGSNYTLSHNLGTLLDVQSGDIGSYKGSNLLISMFGRAVYNYNDKYLLTATVRRDGSSKFGDDNKWGWFPSASVGWNIDNENFMESLTIFDQLKLRVSWGITGNQEIPRYLSQTTYAPQGSGTNPETGSDVISFAGNRIANPNLKWEENEEWNFGLDFAILKSRLSGSVEYYMKKTYDLLYEYAVPKPPNKFDRVWDNGGSIDNNGIEFSIQAFVIDKKNFDWKTTIVFSKNNQTFKSFDTDNKYGGTDERKEGWVSGRGLVGTYTQLIREGYELGTYYLPVYAGLSQDGVFLFQSESGGVTRDITKAERKVVGNAQPDFELGWSNYINFYQNFDLSFSFRAVYNFDVYNATAMFFNNPSVLPNLNATQEAINEANRGLTSTPQVSDYYLEDGSFVRLENITLGYTFNAKEMKWLKKFRVYITANNLFTLTNYSGIDPEISYSGLSFGLDNFDVYPKTRSYTFGLNLNF